MNQIFWRKYMNQQEWTQTKKCKENCVRKVSSTVNSYAWLQESRWHLPTWRRARRHQMFSINNDDHNNNNNNNHHHHHHHHHHDRINTNESIVPEGTKRATAVKMRFLRLQKDLRTGSISRDSVNFPSELCRRRSGTSTQVARLVPPETWGKRHLAPPGIPIRAKLLIVCEV